MASHRNCARCHTARIDKRAAHNMCRSCRRQYEAELKAQRTAASERRAARVAAQNGVSVNAEPEPEPERVTPPVLPPKRDRLESISDDLKLIIAGHYAN